MGHFRATDARNISTEARKKYRFRAGSAKKRRFAGGALEALSARASMLPEARRATSFEPMNKPEKLLQLVRAYVEGFLISWCTFFAITLKLLPKTRLR